MKHIQTLDGRTVRGLGLRVNTETYDLLERLAQERRDAGRAPGSFGIATIAREVLEDWAAEQRRSRSAA